jgi:hypothetical protein
LKIVLTLASVLFLSSCASEGYYEEMAEYSDTQISSALKAESDKDLCTNFGEFINPIHKRVRPFVIQEVGNRNLGDCSESAQLERQKHTKCLSFGFTKPSAGYSDCRMTLHKEELDTDRANARASAAAAGQFNKGMQDFTKGYQDPLKNQMMPLGR